MILILKSGTTSQSIKDLSSRLEELGFAVEATVGIDRTVLTAIGEPVIDKYGAAEQFRAHPSIEKVVFVGKPYRKVSVDSRTTRTLIRVKSAVFGSGELVIMAGPCTVESEEQVMSTASLLNRLSVPILRGGAYKPSTSPYGFQGLGLSGLEILRNAAQAYDLAVITEVMDPRKVELVAQFADILQIGTRNMQNYDLLKEAASSNKPILLKRGMSAKIEEWLLAAEYIACAGNEQIILCERGIRSFDGQTRNTLDLAAVPVSKSLSHLPIVVDPSHGTGRADLVGPMSLAAVAVGADGLLLEVHPSPKDAIKDGVQSLSFDAFEALLDRVKSVAKAVSPVTRF